MGSVSLTVPPSGPGRRIQGRHRGRIRGGMTTLASAISAGRALRTEDAVFGRARRISSGNQVPVTPLDDDLVTHRPWYSHGPQS